MGSETVKALVSRVSKLAERTKERFLDVEAKIRRDDANIRQLYETVKEFLLLYHESTPVLINELKTLHKEIEALKLVVRSLRYDDFKTDQGILKERTVLAPGRESIDIAIPTIKLSTGSDV